ncbi:unnamed protein product [Cylicocyclus nassatus]|uniref:Uncharacterized protein n=1 Tax=Cylicocyclus nassatus TaxID=53992 RepID=A0AA36DMA4_CYLNA|nr:unnamed protein product [Cylicocyclus nassatus]
MARYLLPTHPPGFLDVIPDEIKEDDGVYKLPLFRDFENSEQGELPDSLNGRVLIMEGKHNINENNGFSMRGIQHFDNMDDLTKI